MDFAPCQVFRTIFVQTGYGLGTILELSGIRTVLGIAPNHQRTAQPLTRYNSTIAYLSAQILTRAALQSLPDNQDIVNIPLLSPHRIVDRRLNHIGKA